MRKKTSFSMNALMIACLLLHSNSCTWTTGAGEKRRSYILGFGVISQPMHGAQEPSKAWVQELRGIGLGITHGAGPSHVFCGAFASHETALPTAWEGVVEYKKNPQQTDPPPPPASKKP